MVSLFSVMNFDFLTENSLFFSRTYISKTGKNIYVTFGSVNICHTENEIIFELYLKIMLLQHEIFVLCVFCYIAAYFVEKKVFFSGCYKLKLGDNSCV